MQEKQLEWLQEADLDLYQISAYIAMDSMFYADKTVEQVQLKAQMLKSFPYMGRIVPEINQYSIRELIYKSYRIIYQNYHKIYIIRIIHSSRNIL